MSYANGTTHYNLPQTVGSDKRDWFDTNEAFAAIDAALYGAVQTSGEVSAQLSALVGRVTSAEGAIQTVGETVAEHGIKISTLEGTVGAHTNQIADVRQDAEDMICAYNEGAAETSTHAYAIGDYFVYNDVLYKATAAISVGATIVPNTNCEATNVTTRIILLEDNVSDIADNLSSMSGRVTALEAVSLSETRVAIACNTAVSGIAPFAYKGSSLPVANGTIYSVTIEKPSSGDWVFSVDVDQNTHVVTVYTNGSANVFADIVYKRSNS